MTPAAIGMTAASIGDVPVTALDLQFLEQELLHFITDAITNHPRSLQKRIGPSELGIPCARRIGYKLAGVEPVNNRGAPWKPTIGTAVHTWLEGIMRKTNVGLGEMPAEMGGGPRFLLEHKVRVGQICGDDIDGSCDLYDRATDTVVDWKVVGGEQLRKYKKEGPGVQYRTQGHCYGRGWQHRGMPVKHVAVMFLPRDKELREAHFWHEAYDEQVAVDALTKVDGITKLVRALGPGAIPLLPTADAWCSYCPHFMPAATELHEACPGDAGATIRT